MEFNLRKEKNESRKVWIDSKKWCDQKIGNLADHREDVAGNLGVQSREIGEGKR